MVTKEDKDMEAVLVSGIAYDKNETKIAVMHVPDKPGIAAKLLTPCPIKYFRRHDRTERQRRRIHRFYLYGHQG